MYFCFKTSFGTSTKRLKYTRGMCNENSIKLDLNE